MAKRFFSRFLLLGCLTSIVSSQAFGYAHEIIDEKTSTISPASVIQSIENEIIANEHAKIEAKRTSDLRLAVKTVDTLTTDLILAPKTTLDTALLPQKRLPTDEIFIGGWKAYQSGQLDRLEKTRSALPYDHPLGAYLDLWTLNLRLKKNVDNPTVNIDFVDFVDRHEGSYVGERAAADYLSIVGHRINRDLFNRLYSRLKWNQYETELRAWNYFYNYSDFKTEEIQSFIAEKRITGKPLMHLLEKALYDDLSWYWTAIMLLMQKQQWADALALIESLPEDMLPASKITLRSIINDPVHWAERYGRYLNQRPPRLSMFLTLRLASSRPDLAAEMADRVMPKLSQKWSDMLNASLSYSLSVGRHSEEAIERFERIRGPLSDNSALFNATQIQIWVIKAYLRAENWEAVNRLIQNLPQSRQNEELWLYWRARALEATGQKQAAQGFYERVAGNITFYGKLASDAIGRGYPTMPNDSVLPDESTPDWKNNPSLLRSIDFYRMELYGLGHREWNWATRDVDRKDYLSLADFALRNHLIHRMINTSLHSGIETINIRQRFPTPQLKLFKMVCGGQEIPTSWAYGLIRQESRFMLTVASAVGARGLMQIMPSTARWLARKLELNDYEHNRLTELEMNLILGTSYLRMLKSEFDGSFVLATASYNAGTYRVRQWRDSVKKTIPADIFVETIPYHETRDYVKNVMANMHTYGILLDIPQEKFRDMLGSVTPSPVFNESDLP